MNHQRPLRLTGLALVATLAVTACSGGDEEAASTTVAPGTESPATTSAATTAAPDTTGAPTTLPAPPTTVVPDVPRMPLTGEPVDSVDATPNRPTLITKVPMDPVAMPQVGLNAADIVFQTIINDNYTRLLAAYHSVSPGTVGPIRSGRQQDVDIMAAFHRPLYAWSGGNASVNGLMAGADDEGLLVDLRHGSHGSLYYRDGRAEAPHNLFSDTNELWLTVPGVDMGWDDLDGGEEAAAPTTAAPSTAADGTAAPASSAPPEAAFERPMPIFPYVIEGSETIEGPSAEEINVRLDSFRSHWEYDGESGRYFKWNNGSEHMADDGQVWADNVVVMMMDYGVDPADGNPLMQSTGSNPVYIFSEGTVREGIWLRFDRLDGWGFFDNADDLNRLPLTPGRTWVEMPRNDAGNASWVSDGEEVVPGAATTAPEGTVPATTTGDDD